MCYAHTVFLGLTETGLFVDRLFCGLESESYLTGHDPATPPPAAALTGTPPTGVQVSKTAALKPLPSKPQSAVPPQPMKFHSGGGAQSVSGSSSVGRSAGLGDKGRVGGTNSDRRHSEDLRSREVSLFTHLSFQYVMKLTPFVVFTLKNRVFGYRLMMTTETFDDHVIAGENRGRGR